MAAGAGSVARWKKGASCGDFSKDRSCGEFVSSPERCSNTEREVMLVGQALSEDADGPFTLQLLAERKRRGYSKQRISSFLLCWLLELAHKELPPVSMDEKMSRFWSPEKLFGELVSTAGRKAS